MAKRQLNFFFFAIFAFSYNDFGGIAKWVLSWSRIFHYFGCAKKNFLSLFLSFFSMWLWTLIERCGVSKLTNQQTDPFSFFFKSDVTLSRHNLATYASSKLLKQILPFLAKINRMVLTHQNHRRIQTELLLFGCLLKVFDKEERFWIWFKL